MKVLVTGGRDYKLFSHVIEVMDHLHKEYRFSVLIHGDAGSLNTRGVPIKGVDKLAGRWAYENGIQRVVVPANWTGLGDRAGMARNKFMLELTEPHLCVAFPGGRGTSNMMRLARMSGVTLIATEDLILP